MWGVEIEKKIQDILEHQDAKYRETLSQGFFYRSNPLFIPKIHFRETLVFLLHHQVTTSARILDFACGTGQMLLFLWHFGFRRLFGWDANPDLLSGAAALFAQLADLDSVELRKIERDCIYNIKGADPQPFDVITIFGLIYGMGIDPLRAIASARDALKPGGFLICNDHVHEPAVILDAIGAAGLSVRRHVAALMKQRAGNHVYFCQKAGGRDVPDVPG